MPVPYTIIQTDRFAFSVPRKELRDIGSCQDLAELVDVHSLDSHRHDLTSMRREVNEIRADWRAPTRVWSGCGIPDGMSMYHSRYTNIP